MAVGAPSARLLCNRPFYYKLTQFNHLISSERRRGTPPCKAQELASEPYPPHVRLSFQSLGLQVVRMSYRLHAGNRRASGEQITEEGVS